MLASAETARQFIAHAREVRASRAGAIIKLLRALEIRFGGLWSSTATCASPRCRELLSSDLARRGDGFPIGIPRPLGKIATCRPPPCNRTVRGSGQRNQVRDRDHRSADRDAGGDFGQASHDERASGVARA